MKEKLFSVTKKDLKIDFFSGTGAGGQHRNKHQNCVRIQHPPSGVMVTGQSSRERKSNIREAMQSLVSHPKFKFWLAGAIQQAKTGKSIEDLVDDSMAPKNLKIEYKTSDSWEIQNA